MQFGILMCAGDVWSVLELDMSKWANPAHTGWLTTSRVKNEWTQPGSLSSEPEIL